MTPQQRIALQHPILLAGQVMDPRFMQRRHKRKLSVMLTVNRGYG